MTNERLHGENGVHRRRIQLNMTVSSNACPCIAMQLLESCILSLTLQVSRDLSVD